jgi:putative tryptophan/tyrosine transport system substrate-binding protein
MFSMGRREFVSLLGGVAAAWPLAARAQQPAMPVIGFLNSGSAQAQVLVAAAFRQGLNEAGFVDGRNVTIESRFADGQYDRLDGLTADLLSRHAAAIVAGGPPAARAAKAATSNVPIVFTSGDDPVITGLVASMNRPGGNVTGVHILFTELETKKLGLLRELMPQAAVIAVLLNPSFPSIETQTRELQSAAHALGQPIQIFTARSERELDAAFESMRQLRVGALLVGADPFFASRRTQIIRLHRATRSPWSTSSARSLRPAV